MKFPFQPFSPLSRSRSRLKAPLYVLALSASLLTGGPVLAAGEPSPGGVNAGTLKLPSGPASVAGLADNASLSPFTGQVTYSIPVDMPAGRAGFKPSMAVAYNGALGNGPMGIGWSLVAPHVKRSTRLGVPTYTDADELDLVGVGGGGRLIEVTSGAYVGEYRVEGKGNAVRVIRQFDGWVVTTSDGTKYTFVERQFGGDGTQAYSWYLTSVEALQGQYATFHYDEVVADGDVYLTAVRWGYNSSQGGTPMFEAVLEYEARADIVTSYRSGDRIATTQRLATITVNAHSNLRRKYRFTYGEPIDPDAPSSPASAIATSRLLSVQVTGTDDTLALPTLSFTYNGYTAPESDLLDVTGLDGWNLSERGATLLDVDGDGLQDMARFQLGQERMWKRNLGGGAFGPEQSLPGADQVHLDDARLADLDGDLRPELIYIVNDTWRVYSNTDGTGFTQYQGEWPNTFAVPLVDSHFVHTDIDGDRQTDVLEAKFDGLNVRWGSVDSGLSDPVRQGMISPLDPGLEVGDRNVKFHDMNGDGLPDAVWLLDERMLVYWGRGDGTFDHENRADWTYPWGEFDYIDTDDVRIADLNRDGLMDLVWPGVSKVYWARGLTNGFEKDPRSVARPEGAYYDDIVTIADMDGDGAQDVVWSGTHGMWVLRLAGAATEASLKTISNGLGKTTTFAYTTSTIQQRDAEVAGLPWNDTFPLTQAVVKSVTVDTGVVEEEERVVATEIRDGFWDVAEQRFGGFLKSVQVTQGDTDVESLQVTTTYEKGEGTSRVLRGMASTVGREDLTGHVFDDVQNVYDAQVITSLPADEPLLRVAKLIEATTLTWEGETTARYTRKRTEHDGEGYPTAQTDEGEVASNGNDLGDDTTIVELEYAPRDEATWVQGLVCRKTTKAAGGAIVAEAWTVYDREPGVEPAACTASEGLVRATYGYVAPYDTEPAKWLELTKTDYTTWGAPKLVREAGVVREIAYDSNHLHPTTETIYDGVTATDLVWSLTWDQTLGVPEQLTDPNGDEQEVVYDALGRVLEVKGDHDSDGTLETLTTYQYDWQTHAPRPQTTTIRHEDNTGPANGESVAVFNGAGEPLLSAVRLTSASWIVSGHRVRNKLGKTIEVYNPRFWGSATLPTGPPDAQTAPAEDLAHQTVEYDALGRVTRQTLPLVAAGTTTKDTTFGQFQVTYQTSGLDPVTTELDGQGRIFKTTRTVGGVLEEVAAVWDAAGRLVRYQLQPNGSTSAQHNFAYDTLGRLRWADDPDIGERTVKWDDNSRIIETTNEVGDSVGYTYDFAGRLETRSSTSAVNSSLNETFTFYYDAPNTIPAGQTVAQVVAARRTIGRLAEVAESSTGIGAGSVLTSYDAMGRTAWTERTIDGRSLRSETDFSASGLVLAGRTLTANGPNWDVRVEVEHSYDTAARLTQLRHAFDGSSTFSNLWSLVDARAGGEVLEEDYGNGLTHVYERDVLGQVERFTLDDTVGGAGGPHVDLEFTRFLWGAVSEVHDLAPTTVGANDWVRSAKMTYDGAGRLTEAKIGGKKWTAGAWDGTTSWDFEFSYQYDALQNMTQRVAPAAVDVFAGNYAYGGSGAGPRQLTSVTPIGGGAGQSFVYDKAGRMVRQYDATKTAGQRQTEVVYDPFDRVRQVELHSDGGSPSYVDHWYGYDGERVRTEYHADATALGVQALEDEWRFGPGLVVRGDDIEVVVSLGPRAVARLEVDFGASGGGAVQWLHQTFGPGPSVVSDSGGVIRQDRMFAPFGTMLKSYDAAGAGGISAVADAQLAGEPLSWVNKEVERATTWSDHGARWYASRTGRWLSPDPPVKGPGKEFLAAPWDVHPYQYGSQSPVAFWDPDGNKPRPLTQTEIDANVGAKLLSEGAQARFGGRSSKVEFRNGLFECRGCDRKGFTMYWSVESALRRAAVEKQKRWPSYFEKERSTPFAKGLRSALDEVKKGLKEAAIDGAVSMASGGAIVALKLIDMLKHIQRARQVSLGISKAKGFDCASCAKKIAAKLDAEGIPYSFIRVSDGAGKLKYGGLWSDKARKIIGQGEHIGIEVHGVVFDNIHKRGMSRRVWVKDIQTHGSKKVDYPDADDID